MSGRPSLWLEKRVRSRSKLIGNLQPRASQASMNSSSQPLVVLLTPGATRAWTEGKTHPSPPSLGEETSPEVQSMQEQLRQEVCLTDVPPGLAR